MPIDYWKLWLKVKDSTWLKTPEIIFCIVMLTYSFSIAHKSSLPATPAQLNQVMAAANIDHRVHIADELASELNANPDIKLWELDRVKQELGLRYVDSKEFKNATLRQQYAKDMRAGPR